MAIKGLLAIISTFLFFFAIHNTAGQTGGNHGDSCDVSGTSDCNFNKHLSCLQGRNGVYRCGCYNATELYYNSSSGECTAPINKPCNPMLSDGTDPINCTPRASCVNITDFHSFGTCECVPGNIEDEGIYCKLGHNAEVCRDSSDCYEKGFLKCSFGTCICDQNNATHVNQEWNEESQTCQGLVGVTCRDIPGQEACVSNAVCDKGKCACKPDFTATEDRKCLKSLDQNCTADSECLSGFCKNGTTELPQATCSCTEGQISFNDQCFIKAEDSCRENTLGCVENAYCNSVNVCTCNNGYSSTRIGECAASYGSSCAIDSPTETCNVYDHLVCNNSATGDVTNCNCITNYEYNSDVRRCQGLFGSSCNLDRNNDCVASTVCTNGTDTARCGCAENLSEGIDKKCKANYGGDCSVFECDASKFESCDATKICACQSEDLHYDTSLGFLKCVLKIGAPCGAGGLSPGCVANATCPLEGDNRVCECNLEFSPNEDSTVCLPGGSSGALKAGNIMSLFLFVILALYFH